MQVCLFRLCVLVCLMFYFPASYIRWGPLWLWVLRNHTNPSQLLLMRAREYLDCYCFHCEACLYSWGTNYRGRVCGSMRLLGFYILAIFKVISGWVPNCDSAHSWRLYSAASLEPLCPIKIKGHIRTGAILWQHELMLPLGDQVISTHSHYPDTELTRP